MHTAQTHRIAEKIEPVAHEASSMTAVVQGRYGTADVFELREIPRPTLGDHDVLVRVAAASVDRGV